MITRRDFIAAAAGSLPLVASPSLFSNAQSATIHVRTVTDLKADFGFVEHRITPFDLGLKDKEVLAAPFCDGPLIKSKYSFDEKMLMMAIEGMVNRFGPLIFLDFTPSGWRGDATWIKYYGESRGSRFVGMEENSEFASFLRKTAPMFHGIILFDPEPSDSYWLAMNLASLNFCLPVSRRIYDENHDCFRGLQVVMDLSAHTLSRTEINDWMIREVLPRTDLSAAYSAACDFPDLKLYSNWEELALGLDYAFYRRMFMFNLSPLPAKMDGLMGADGSPEMAREHEEIMLSLKPPAAMFGWSVSEAQFSDFGHFQCDSASAPNLSFHAEVKPLKTPPYRQNLLPRIERPEKKIYLSFAANEGDTLVVLSQLYYGDSWLDPARGKIPLNWPINPFFAHLFPSLVEYYIRTKTENDYFVCGPSGAGYVHPDSMKKADLDRFLRFTRHWMKQGVTTKEIILWEGQDPAVQAAYANEIPELRGLTTKPEEIYPWGEMLLAGNRDVPVLREPVATQYWMLNKSFISHDNYSDPVKVRQFEKLKVNVDGFLQYLDELDHHVEKPYCFMVYGLQINLPSEIARIHDAMDKDRFEIVDMGTLFHLASFESGKIKQETAALLNPRNYPAAVAAPDAFLWKPELLHDSSQWKSVDKAIVSATGKGVRVEIPVGVDSACTELNGVLIPSWAKRIRIRVSEVRSCRWVLLVTGDFSHGPVEAVDIQGHREMRAKATWQPFSEWSQSRQFPGADDRPLDKEIIANNLRGRPVTLGLKVQGSDGGYAVFEKIEFTDGVSL